MDKSTNLTSFLLSLRISGSITNKRENEDTKIYSTRYLLMCYVVLCILLIIIIIAIFLYVKGRCFPSNGEYGFSNGIDSSTKAVYTVYENTLGFYQLNLISSSLDDSCAPSILCRDIGSSASLLSWNRDTKEIYICCSEECFTHNQLTVYSVSPDGKDKKRITTVVADEIKISNDGFFLFYVQRDAFHLIFRKDLRDNSITQLTESKEFFEIECWDIAPDGSFVVFKANEKRDDGNGGTSYLYRVTGDGSKITQIAEHSPNFPIHYIAVSPNSDMILTGDHYRIFLCNSFGKNRKCIKQFPKDFKIDSVFWGPNNGTICFECYDECYLHMLNIRGKKRVIAYPSICSKCLFISEYFYN